MLIIAVAAVTMAIEGAFDQISLKRKRIAHLSEKTINGRCSGTDVVVNRLGTIIINNTPTRSALLYYFIVILHYVKRQHKIKMCRTRG